MLPAGPVGALEAVKPVGQCSLVTGRRRGRQVGLAGSPLLLLLLRSVCPSVSESQFPQW